MEIKQMTEFRRVIPGLISAEERLEEGLRVIDPLFGAVWQASLPLGREFFYLELCAKRATGVVIDRRGIVRHLPVEEEIGRLIEGAVQFMHGAEGPCGAVVFGNSAETWARKTAFIAEQGPRFTDEQWKIYATDKLEVFRAANEWGELFRDERIAVEISTEKQVRFVFGHMMDAALLSAHRQGLDADDMETERLVRMQAGGPWQGLEQWVLSHMDKPVELRLRSVIPQPAKRLPVLVEIRS